MKRLLWVILVVFALVSVGALTAQDDAPPFLGITFDAADDGVLVTRVLPATAAAEAGLQVGDVITAANDEAATTESLPALVTELAVGDTLMLDILRAGEAMTLEATLQARPMVQERLRVGPMMGRGFLGVTLETTDNGLQIAAVSEGSPAAEAGLQAGDIVTALNGEAVTTPIEAARLISSLEPGATLNLSVLRDGESLELEATLADAPALGRMMDLPGDMIVYDGTNWRVMGLAEDSPLAAAGLAAGDVITAVDGAALDPAALAELLAAAEDDTTVVLTVERGDETLDVTVNVADLNFLGGMGFFRGRDGRGPRGDMPFRFEMLPGAVRLGVQFEMVDEGALIIEVLPESPAATAGLQADDIVIGVGGDVVDAERTLRDRLLAYEAGDTVTLAVLRDGETLELDVTLAAQTFERGDMPFFHHGMPFEFDGENMPHFFFGPHGEFRMEPETVAPLAPNA